MEQNQSKSTLMIPGAIVIAGLLVAGAVIFTSGGSGDTTAAENGANNAENKQQAAVQDVEVRKDDHLRGNPDASIVIVEYSDTECPFCKRFHNTMKQVMDEYGGPDGEVAWVYRQFPIPQLHSKAPKEARATECAAELGGNDAFWAYLDTIFEETPSNNGLDLARLPDFAEEVGLDRAAFTQCLENNTFEDKLEEHRNLATESGARGTPYSVAVVRGGENFAIPGAQPFTQLKQKIDSTLEEVN